MNDVSGHIERLRSYLSADPGNVSLACDLIDAQISASRFDEAAATVAALSPEVSGSAGLRFRRARLALITGRYGDAAEILRALIADGHENVALWHDLAFAQLCMRDTAA